MISLKRCREILGEKGKHLSDEQLEAMRKVLMDLAKTNIRIIQEQKNKKR
jgi:uncharacterized membrane protein